MYTVKCAISDFGKSPSLIKLLIKQLDLPQVFEIIYPLSEGPINFSPSLVGSDFKYLWFFCSA